MDFGNPTKGWSGAVIRREFFKHFGELDRWYSSPLILVEDIKAPLLQTAMNRFKQLFMADLPSGEGSTFSFKCIRIGDTLEDFSDTRYHSLTELLGTWHWGEHRREVISKLLGFLKKECGIKMEDIYATYFAGDENLDADTECRDIMLEFLPKGHVSSSTVKGSFWNVDGSGPCGPCLGIYCDNSTRGYEDRDAWTRISLNHRTIPQIWSLVFVQDNGEALEVLQNIHQSDISAPSTSTTCQNGIPLLNTPEQRFHKTRQINFRGRQINIIHQEFNGPCGLLGICNVLLLRGAISLEPSLTKVPEDHLISLLQMYLEQNKGGLPYSELPRKALEVLPVLPFGLDVDVSFNRTDCFEETPEIILLRYLGVPIYHGWLPDPADVRLAALSSYTYSSLSIATSDDTFQNVDQARELLTGTQFTSYGLRCLYNDLKENVACVLFWHNHCSTLIKVKEQLYLLATDSNYIGTPVVWETLTLEGSGVLVDGDFIPVVESPITPLDQPGTLSVYPPFAPPDQLVPQISSERVLPTTAQWPATNLTSNKGDDTDYVGSLEDYIKIPGNHFAEKKNLSALGTSLEVADTRKIGRIIAKALVLQLKDGHQAMVSWNGKFDRKSILVRSGFHTMLTAWINAAYGEFSDAAIRNDYTTYVNEVLSLFEVEGVGYPAFFHPLIKTLKEESGLDARSHIQFSNFCHKVEGNLAFKFSLARADYWGGINKIRKHAPRQVRRELRRVLAQIALIEEKDWRSVVSESGHPLLRKILRYRREGDNNGENEQEDFGYFLPSIGSASQFARQVNEHADDDTEDDTEDDDKEENLGALSESEASDALSESEAGDALNDDDEEEVLGALSESEAGAALKVKDDDKEATRGALSNLDLLYSHYLEVPLAKAHEQILTSGVSDDLHDWLNDVLELFERLEIN